MAQLKLALLGAPLITVGEMPVKTESRRALAVLIYLAVAPGPQSRDTLATLFWPDQDQSRARSSLRHVLWLLKKAGVADWLTLERETVGLRTGYWLDVAQFRAQIAAGELAAAVALYRDEFLAGFTLRDSPDFDEWQFRQAEELRQLLAGALAQLVDHCHERAEYDAALNYGRRWLALDPLQEAVHRRLMELYAWSGQYGAALRQYEECVRILAEELGAPPEDETQALFEVIRTRRLLPPSTAAPIAGQSSKLGVFTPDTPTPSRAPVAHHLPKAPTPFIGRTQELAELARLLADPYVRLITILGPGGIGKTRLAVAVAEQPFTQTCFPNGVYWAPLASISTEEQLVPAIAEAVAISLETEEHPPRSAEQQLFDYLRQKRLLLILDNCEHLLPGIEWVAKLLQAAPNVQILATSRERLRLHEEQLYPLQGLDYPAGEMAGTGMAGSDFTMHPAFDLFVQSARRVRPNYSLSAGDWRHLARICQLVEGMPLGLELAAAWVGLLPVAKIATEIQTSLDLLETDMRNIPPRQRSIRAVFDASWLRLGEAEQTILMALSVFRGGYSREAAAAVAGASVRQLVKLSDQSLIQYDPVRDRCQIHELLRQYAAERLAQHARYETIVRERHSAHYCAWLQERAVELKGAHQQAVLATLEVEGENAQIAWQWAVGQRQLAQIDQGMDSLGHFFEWQGRAQNGYAIFAGAAEQLMRPAPQVAEAQRLLAKALGWQAVFAHFLGQVTTAQQLLQQSLELLQSPVLASQDTRAEQAFVYRQLGALAVMAGREAAWSLYERSLTLSRALGSDWEISEVLARLGRLAHVLADFAQARALLEESLAIKQRLGEPRGIARVLGLLSQTAVEQAQLDQAEALARQSNAIYQELGDRNSVVEGQRQLAVILLWQGKHAGAHHLLEQTLAQSRELGHRALIAEVRCLFALALSVLGQHEAAQEEAKIGVAQARKIDDRNLVAWSLWVMGWVMVGVQAYAAAELALRESVAIYRQMFRETDEPRHLGWVLSLLAYVSWRLGNQAQALELIREVLPMSLRLRDFLPLLTAMPVTALMLAAHGQKVRAVELYALVWRYPLIANAHGWPAEVGQELATLADELPDAVAAAATIRGQSLDLWQTAAALLEELSLGQLQE